MMHYLCDNGSNFTSQEVADAHKMQEDNGIVGVSLTFRLVDFDHTSKGGPPGLIKLGEELTVPLGAD
jgi:hypothetical protein